MQAASWGEGLNLDSLQGSDDIKFPVYHHSKSSSLQGHLAGAATGGLGRASSPAYQVWPSSSLSDVPSCDPFFYSGSRVGGTSPSASASIALPSSPPKHPQLPINVRLETIASVGSIKGGSSSATSAGNGASIRGSILGGTPAGPGSSVGREGSSGAVSDADGGASGDHHTGQREGGASVSSHQGTAVLCEADLIALACMDCSKEQQAGKAGDFWGALLPLASQTNSEAF